jgi:hypothetical protein
MNEEDRIGDTYVEVLVHLLTSTPEAWNTVLGRSLRDLDPWNEPKPTLDALLLKGGAMAQSLLDAFGREKTGRLLGALRQRQAGQTYARDDVVAAGHEIGEDLEPWLDLWIEQTKLPGFTLGEVAYYRLQDGPDGAPRYQTRVTVRNEEDPPGLLRLEYRLQAAEGSARQRREQTEPVLFSGRSAMDIGLVTSAPLQSLRVAPYFALNRDPFSVSLPSLDAERKVAEEPFSGWRPAVWEPPAGGAIVVDDLDEGFAVEEKGERELLRVAGRGDGDEELDQGLPITRLLSATRWSRKADTRAYGKYRRTAAVVRAGEGNRHAIFNAQLPDVGSWELELHLPGELSEHQRPGKWQLVVEDAAGGSHEIAFDANAGQDGWNSLGSLDLPRGAVRVKISDQTDGAFVVADAIRLTPTGARQVASR